MVFDQGVLHVIGKVKGKQIQTRHKNNTHTNLAQLRNILETGQMRVCIIRSLGGIGDVLMSTPTLRAIKHQWPGCHLTYATDFKYMDGSLKDILLYNPYIDDLISYHIVDRQKFDFISDITSCCIAAERSNARPPNRIEIFADHVGVDLSQSGYLPDYIVSDSEKAFAKEKLQRYPLHAPNTKRIGIQVRTSTVARTWPIEKTRELAIKLAADRSLQVCIFDSPFGQGPREDWNISGLVNLSNMDIRSTAALINEMDLIVTPDTGMLHIAGALNKRIVSLWAGIDYNARINHYPNAVPIVRENYKCYPCFYSPQECQNKYTCLHSISVDEVSEAVYNLLDKPILEVSRTFIEKSGVVDIIRKTGGVGDIVCTTAAVHEFKKQKPDLDIRMILPAQYLDIYKHNPDISELIPLEQYRECSKSVYDLTAVDARAEVAALKQHLNPPSRKHTYLQALGVSTSEILQPVIYLTEEEKQWAKAKLFQNIPGKKTVGVVLFAAESYRCWPLEHYSELFKIAEKELLDTTFVLLDGQRIRQNFGSNVLDMSGFQLREFFSLINAVDVILAPDTSVIHIAGAFHKPCIALFGPIDWKTRCSGYLNSTILCSQRKCVPCWRNINIPCKQNPGNDISKCLVDIKPIQVLGAVQNAIQTIER